MYFFITNLNIHLIINAFLQLLHQTCLNSEFNTVNVRKSAVERFGFRHCQKSEHPNQDTKLDHFIYNIYFYDPKHPKQSRLVQRLKSE